MITFNLSKGSLLYRLVDVYTRSYDIANNICGLIRQVIGGLLVVAGLICIVSMFLGGWVDFLLWLIIYRQDFFNNGIRGFGLTIVFLTLMFVTLFGIIWLGYLYDQRKKKYDDNPGFLRLAYKSIHDKVCFHVEVVD